MAKRKQPTKIDLSIGRHTLLPEPTHRIPVVAAGVGARDIQFPDDLVEQTIKKARGRKGKIKQTEAAEAEDNGTPGQGLLFRSGVGSIWDLIKPVVPPIPDEHFQALVNGSDAIQRLMINRQFDEIMEQIFGDLEDTAAWAVDNMDVSLKVPFTDHQRQVKTLRTQVEDGLPKLVAELARRNPGVSPSVIMKHAIKMLTEQLGPIVSILSVYGAAIAQYRSGKFARQLRCINTYMESCYRLWLSGDVEGTDPAAPPQIPATSLTVGARLLSMIGGPGLGTIPGAKGPVGLSLLMYPADMLDWISLSLTLNSHESGHQIFADLKGFEPEMQLVVKKAVAAALANSTLKFVSPVSAVGRNRVPTADLVVKMITDCIGEIEADVAGVLVNGPAFGYGMALTFPAMLIREGSVKSAKQLLRTSSVYMLEPQENGSMALEFESHPPDYIRVYLVAAMLEEMGYKADADRLRKLADQMVGTLPESLTWEDAEGKSSRVISIKIADIKAVAPVVAKALIREQLTSLGSRSLGELVCFKAKQQAKAEALKKILLAGNCTIPTDIGSIYPTLVGSAAALAYWDAVHEHDGNDVLPQLDENVLKMLEALAVKGK